MAEPLTVEKLAEAIKESGYTLDRGPYVEEWPQDERDLHRANMQGFTERSQEQQSYRCTKLAKALMLLVREALDAERLAATRDALIYAEDWRVLAGDEVADIRGRGICPVCVHTECDDDCPLAPIRNRQEPTDG